MIIQLWTDILEIFTFKCLYQSYVESIQKVVLKEEAVSVLVWFCINIRYNVISFRNEAIIIMTLVPVRVCLE